MKRTPELSRRQRDTLDADLYQKEDFLDALALDAIKQIQQRQYTARFQQHAIKTVVLVGIVFLGKEVGVKYVEVKLQ